MVDINLVLPLVLLVVMLMSFPLLIQFYVRKKTKGRHLCAILEKDKPLNFKLLKIVKDDFVVDGADEWILKTQLMKLVRYPIGWPTMLGSFQQIVTCSLLMRGRSDPLDWENPPTGALSSKEIPVVLDPHWLINLVKGVGEEGRTSRGDKMLMYMSVGISGVVMVMMFYVISKIGSIEQALAALKAVAR